MADNFPSIEGDRETLGNALYHYWVSLNPKLLDEPQEGLTRLAFP